MKEILKARQAEILKCLITSSTPLDIDFFRERLHKGERTVRYDIGQLRELCSRHQIDICYLTKKGYYIPTSQKAGCSQFFLQCEVEAREGLIGSDEEERFQRIFLYLFVRNCHVTAEKIAETYFISRSTLTRFLGKMESYYKNQFFLDAKKSLGYRLDGDELALRRLATGMVAARFKGSYTAEDWYMLLPEECKGRIRLQDIMEIGRSIRQMNARYNIWISNAAYLNLLSYCIVRSIRLYSQKGVAESSAGMSEEPTYAQELLKELSARKEGKTEQELFWLSEILADNGIFTEGCMIEDEVLNRLLNRITAFLEESGKEKFNLSQLYQDLFGHLKNVLSLSLSGRQEEENSYILNEVREYYDSYYQLAKECAVIIEEETGMTANTTEICYLAVYLYKNSDHAEDERKNVLVVCATGKGLSHLLTLRIKNVFPALDVVGQISPYQLSRASDLKNVDFVISTVPLENTVVPVVKISRILSEEDIKRIKDFLRYGKLVDDIPLNQKNEASFAAKKDPFLLAEKNILAGEESLVQAATTLSKLIMTLLEYTSKFPAKFQLGRDAMLGMIIHMSMAVPRWFEGGQTEESEEFEQEYYRIKKRYPDVFALMDKFFGLVEETLQIRISISERVAFFLYIIEEE